MADEAEAPVEQKKPKFTIFLVICAVVGFISGGLGFGTMMFLNPGRSSDAAESEVALTETVFVPFDSVSCNINDGQLNRFLKVAITMQFQNETPDTTELEALVESKKPILTSWVLSYLSDKTMEDIRGAVGQNRLRREIKNHFSETLFPEGDRQIESLLFEEFIVQ